MAAIPADQSAAQHRRPALKVMQRCEEPDTGNAGWRLLEKNGQAKMVTSRQSLPGSCQHCDEMRSPDAKASRRCIREELRATQSVRGRRGLCPVKRLIATALHKKAQDDRQHHKVRLRTLRSYASQKGASRTLETLKLSSPVFVFTKLHLYIVYMIIQM